MIKLFTDPDQTHELLTMMREPRKTLRPLGVEKCILLVYHIGLGDWKKWADEKHSLAFVYRETTRGEDVTNDCSPAGGAEKATGLDRGL